MAQTKTQIEVLNFLKIKAGAEVGTSDVIKKFKISRQRAAQILSQLVAKGLIEKSGSTRNARYVFGLANKPAGKMNTKIQLIREIKNLEEDLVFNEIALKLNLKKRISENSFQIASYAFIKMLNNAIDHSASKKVKIDFTIETKDFSFSIDDLGVGAFEKMRSGYKLKSLFDGIEHLFKGKQTTDPKRHSGQGIFFTSRIADEFCLSANGFKVRINNGLDDLFLSESKRKKGTLVEFRLSKQSRKSLKKLFEAYSNTDFEFDRDLVKVKLSQHEGLLSRSQAKRLLLGLEKFSRIEFDFTSVKEVGQAFADEIFRVWARSQPKILLSYSHASSAVAFLIERARKG